MRSYQNIPAKLLSPTYSNEDISIIIGENGSGKSSLLNEISHFYLSQGMNVIAIANSIYDKFSSRNIRFKILKASTGKTLAKKTLVETLKKLGEDDLRRIRNIANTLDYIGYDPIISFRIKGLNPNFRDIIIDADISSDMKETFLFFLNRFIDRNFQNNQIVGINFHIENFDDLKNSFMIQIFQFDKELKSLKLMKGIDIFLAKHGNLIPLNNASSGELSLITTLLYVTTMITENTIILIDEPENSLHPKWQIEYIKKLDELFYLFQPKIVVATHSPLIINGAELNTENIKIFKGNGGEFIYHENEKINIEEIYQDYFDVTAPQNRYLSEYLITQLNLLADKKISMDEFSEQILELKDNSYDDEQKATLSQILDMGNEILKNIS